MWLNVTAALQIKFKDLLFDFGNSIMLALLGVLEISCQ